MRFTVKIFAGYLLASALTLATAAVFMMTIRRYEQANHVLFLLEQIRANEQALKSSLLLELRAIGRHLARPDAGSAATVRDHAAQSAALMEKIIRADQDLVGNVSELSFPADRLRYFASLKGELKAYESQFENIRHLLAASPALDPRQARVLSEGLEQAVLGRIDEMDRSWEQNIGQVAAIIQQQRRRAIRLIVGLVAATLAIGLGVSVSVVISVRRASRRLSAGMRRVASGDYENPVARGGDPEINVLVDRFNAMAEELRGLEEARRDFISMLSHDLKSPLAVIRMYAETLKGRGLGESREIEAIERSANRMLHLVENVLDYCRTDAAPPAALLRPLSLAPLAEQVCADGDTLGQRLGVAVRAELPADLPPVLADEAQLERALHNLVSNGIKYNRPGGTVTLRAGRQGAAVRVEVEDTGVGISEADRQRLFAKYFRSERTRHVRGTGLGLAVTREIVRAHGSELEISSREGQGTSFRFDLQPAPDPPAGTPEGDGEAVGGGPGG